jgi:hypothetical protein
MIHWREEGAPHRQGFNFCTASPRDPTKQAIEIDLKIGRLLFHVRFRSWTKNIFAVTWEKHWESMEVYQGEQEIKGKYYNKHMGRWDKI